MSFITAYTKISPPSEPIIMGRKSHPFLSLSMSYKMNLAKNKIKIKKEHEGRGFYGEAKGPGSGIR